MNFARKTIIVLFLFVSMINNALVEVGFVVDIPKIANSKDHKQQDTCTVWFFADRHSYGDHRLNVLQQNQIINAAYILERIYNKKVLIVTEDPLFYNSADPIFLKTAAPVVQQFIKEHSSRTVTDGCPFGLSDKAVQYKIMLRNDEFRHAKQASLAGAPISARQVVAQTLQVYKKIEGYNDGPVLNAVYDAIRNGFNRNFNANKKYVEKLANSAKNLQQIMQEEEANLKEKLTKKAQEGKVVESDFYPLNEFREFVEAFDATLLNARLLHSIAIGVAQCDHIFVVAGGAHIFALQSALEKNMPHNKFLKHDIDNSQVIYSNGKGSGAIDLMAFFGKYGAHLANAAIDDPQAEIQPDNGDDDENDCEDNPSGDDENQDDQNSQGQELDEEAGGSMPERNITTTHVAPPAGIVAQQASNQSAIQRLQQALAAFTQR